MAKPFGDSLQCHIADRVPVTVVDLLEIVQVDQQHTNARAGLAAGSQCRLQRLAEQDSVR